MNNMIWYIVALKLFVVCWLIYILFERRKRKRQNQNVIIIEEGPVTAFAGAPVTQLPKDGQEYYSQQLYASPQNVMPPPIVQQQQAFYSHQQPPPPIEMMSPK
ncbi:uncharacterized protein [Musca autumnalis]|uniref:uncharacterized protein n=1 Tax=Musca autumnalis TaxID=221902 RepID=UPI003CEE418E